MLSGSHRNPVGHSYSRSSVPDWAVVLPPESASTTTFYASLPQDSGETWTSCDCLQPDSVWKSTFCAVPPVLPYRMLRPEAENVVNNYDAEMGQLLCEAANRERNVQFEVDHHLKNQTFRNRQKLIFCAPTHDNKI